MDICPAKTGEVDQFDLNSPETFSNVYTTWIRARKLTDSLLGLWEETRGALDENREVTTVFLNYLSYYFHAIEDILGTKWQAVCPPVLRTCVEIIVRMLYYDLHASDEEKRRFLDSSSLNLAFKKTTSLLGDKLKSHRHSKLLRDTFNELSAMAHCNVRASAEGAKVGIPKLNESLTWVQFMIMEFSPNIQVGLARTAHIKLYEIKFRQSFHNCLRIVIDHLKEVDPSITDRVSSFDNRLKEALEEYDAIRNCSFFAGSQ